MKVYINHIRIDILPGMTVRHALMAAGLLREIETSKKACDEWGNELGLDGALSEGMKITVGSTKSPAYRQAGKHQIPNKS